MVQTDKGSKAKTLATASTLQKVVCPAPERDPQEILSNGWRKVGEQKRFTNRIANGPPDLGVCPSSRENSFTDTSGQASRQTGRQVLDKMFGHLRPHHSITPMGVNGGQRPEDQELDTGLGSQAARMAFFRPSVIPQSPGDAAEGGPAPAPPPPQQRSSFSGDRNHSAAKMPGERGRYGSGSEWSEVEIRSEAGADDDLDDNRPSSSSAPSSSPRNSRLRRPGGLAGGSPAAAAPPPPRNGSLTRTTSGGGSIPMSHGHSPRASCGGAVADRRGALPSVSRSYPSDGSPPIAQRPAGGHQQEAPRLPAAAAASNGAAQHGNRRASISGDMALPAIASGGGGAAAGPAAAAAAGKAPPAGTRARRMSQVNGSDGPPDGSGAAGPHPVLPTHIQPPHRLSMPGNGNGNGTSGNGNGTSGNSSTMPQLVRASNGGDNPGARMSARGGGGGHHSTETYGTSSSAATWAPTRGSASVTVGNGGPVPRATSNGGGGGAGGGGGSGEVTAMAHMGLLAQLGELHSGGGGNNGVPLSGLDNLAATGLGDAISQLRNIRLGGSGTNGGPVGAKEPRERKQEPGIAGVTPLQLLPVPLPPLDNWQGGGRQAPDLDPCKGIRLVDTANYVLPRATAEVCLQAKMAHHQAAMRDLVKAEGAPMSEMEMEAVKLLGRLERSGARQRNFEDMDGDSDEGEEAER